VGLGGGGGGRVWRRRRGAEGEVDGVREMEGGGVKKKEEGRKIAVTWHWAGW
jgi:hypothetical protein